MYSGVFGIFSFMSPQVPDLAFAATTNHEALMGFVSMEVTPERMSTSLFRCNMEARIVYVHV